MVKGFLGRFSGGCGGHFGLFGQGDCRAGGKGSIEGYRCLSRLGWGQGE